MQLTSLAKLESAELTTCLGFRVCLLLFVASSCKESLAAKSEAQAPRGQSDPGTCLSRVDFVVATYWRLLGFIGVLRPYTLNPKTLNPKP